MAGEAESKATNTRDRVDLIRVFFLSVVQLIEIDGTKLNVTRDREGKKACYQ
jgi:hypothetical protein